MGKLSRLLNTFRRGRVERDIDEEIQFHLDMRTEGYERQGLPPRDARDAALRRFGGALQAREATRDARLLTWLDTFRQDVVFGFRILCRTPSLSMAAILSLAIGIGGTTGVFAVADALLFRPLPVPAPDRLFALEWRAMDRPQVDLFWGDTVDQASWSFPLPLLRQLETASNTRLAGFQELSETTIYARGEASVANGSLVSGSYFPVLGLTPAEGRLLGPNDDQAGAPATLVLGFRFWRSRFGGDSRVIGESVQVNGQLFTVVGVAPPSFSGIVPGHLQDFYIPLAKSMPVLPDVFGGTDLLSSQRAWWLQAFGRRAEGRNLANLEQAMVPSFGEATSKIGSKPEQRMHLRLREASAGFSFKQGRDARRPLGILLVIAAVVLAIGCANVANLLLARATARQKEASMRLALGAGRLRVLRQHLTESLLLAGAAGIAGVSLALWFGDLLLALAPDPTVVVVDLGLDLRIAAFAAGASLVAGLLSGLPSAITLARASRASAAGASVRVRTGWRRAGLGKPLVAAQMALSLVLLVVAGLFAHSLENIYSQPAGFNTSNLLLFNFDPYAAGQTPERAAGSLASLTEHVASLPGVKAVTWSRPALLDRSSFRSTFKVVDRPDWPEAPSQLLWVGPRFHETLGIDLRLGRLFTDRDTPSSPMVAVVNEQFVATFFRGTVPLGRAVRMPGGGSDYTVVGVVRDTKYSSLGEADGPIIFLCGQQRRSLGSVTFALRTAGAGPEAGAIVRAAQVVEPSIPVVRLRTLEGQLADQLRTEHGLSTLSLLFGGMALALAAVGLYGLVAFGVARRTAEMGVRLALGASRSSILGLILRDSARVVLPGALVGLALAAWGTRLLTSLLFGLEPWDPLALGVAIVLLLTVSLVAAVIPARRAASIAPSAALRCE